MKFVNYGYTDILKITKLKTFKYALVYKALNNQLSPTFYYLRLTS